MNAENENKKPSHEKKKGIDWLLALVAFGYPFMPAFVLFSICEILYLGTGSLFCLILAILTVVGYVGIALYILVSFSKKDSTSYSPEAPDEDPDLTSDEATAFSAGLLGGALLGRTLLKSTHTADKNENDFLWQEKTRREMHDD